jgi:hypothetical protein
MYISLRNLGKQVKRRSPIKKTTFKRSMPTIERLCALIYIILRRTAGEIRLCDWIINVAESNVRNRLLSRES